MAFADIFKRSRKPLDEAEGEGVSPVGGELAGNEAVRRKQRMLLAGVAGVGLVVSSMWIFSGDDGKKVADTDGAEKVEVSTKDMVNRNLSRAEWDEYAGGLSYQRTCPRLLSGDGAPDDAPVAQYSP